VHIQTDIVVFGRGFFVNCFIKNCLDSQIDVVHLVPKHQESRVSLPVAIDYHFGSDPKNILDFRFSPSAEKTAMLYPGPMVWPGEDAREGPAISLRSWNFVARKEGVSVTALNRLEDFFLEQKIHARPVQGYQLLSMLVEPAWTREMPFVGLSLPGMYDIDVEQFSRGIEEYVSEKLGTSRQFEEAEIHSLHADTIQTQTKAGSISIHSKKSIVFCPDYSTRFIFERLFSGILQVDKPQLGYFQFEHIHEFTIHSRNMISLEHVLFFENAVLYAVSPRELRCLVFKKPHDSGTNPQSDSAGPPLSEVSRILAHLLGWDSCTIRGYRRVEVFSQEFAVVKPPSHSNVNIILPKSASLPSLVKEAADWAGRIS